MLRTDSYIKYTWAKDGQTFSASFRSDDGAMSAVLANNAADGWAVIAQESFEQQTLDYSDAATFQGIYGADLTAQGLASGVIKLTVPAVPAIPTGGVDSNEPAAMPIIAGPFGPFSSGQSQAPAQALKAAPPWLRWGGLAALGYLAWRVLGV